jgi:uncharacterized protein
MIDEADKQIIQKIARKYSATRVLLFGSGIIPGAMAHDIDIAVEGVAGKDFFAFYGEIMCALSKPVDVVDLSVKSKFSDLIRREGVLLHA